MLRLFDGVVSRVLWSLEVVCGIAGYKGRSAVHFGLAFLFIDSRKRWMPGAICDRAFRRPAPRLSVVGRCLEIQAVVLFGKLLYRQGH